MEQLYEKYLLEAKHDALACLHRQLFMLPLEILLFIITWAN